MSRNSPSLATISDFIRTVGVSEKRAEALSEPGSQGGETSHPVKDVDDGLEVAQEGERSSENTADVKEDQGEPGVDNTAIAKAGEDGAASIAGSAADDHLQIGTNVQATGDDPENETNKAKSGKTDPGSTHPARTDNEALDGNKYSNDRLAKLSLGQLAKIAADLGDEVCASIAVAVPGTKQASATKTAAQVEAETRLAYQAGWEMGGLTDADFDKQAADALVEEKLFQTIKTASDDADRVLGYLQGFYDQKQADEMGGMPPDMGGMPPEGAMPPDAGGMPPEGGMSPDMGGMPPDMGGMPPEGGGDEAALLSELEGLLAEKGLSLEDLIGMLQGGGGAEGGMPPDAGMPPGGAMPPDAGGAPAMPPPPPEADPAKGMEVQASAKRRAKTSSAVKKGFVNADVAAYIKEVISRSRR